SVHAVVGESGQRCWVERSAVQDRGPRNVAGGVIGAVIGGVIGHQFGAGRGNDAATAGGAIAGAAIGSNQGRESDTRTVDVQRCTAASNATPEYWDVSYRFHDVDHRVQMTSPPGSTIIVNENGEPRQ
ncbi:MAG: glycine zipper 2TM domain-containing protein, partial [Steroidobacteraceae bacterium]